MARGPASPKREIRPRLTSVNDRSVCLSSICYLTNQQGLALSSNLIHNLHQMDRLRIRYIILLSDHRPGVSYVGTILTAVGIYPAMTTVLSWPVNPVSGQTKRCIANAL